MFKYILSSPVSTDSYPVLLRFCISFGFRCAGGARIQATNVGSCAGPLRNDKKGVFQIIDELRTNPLILDF